MNPPRRFVEVRLNRHIPPIERELLVNPRHPAASCGEVPDPGNVEPGQLIQNVEAVIATGEPGDRNRPVETDGTRCDGVVDRGEPLEAFRGGDELPGGLGCDIDPARNPFDQGPVPVTQRRLTPVQLPQNRHLSAAGLSDHGFVFE